MEGEADAMGMRLGDIADVYDEISAEVANKTPLFSLLT